MNKNHDHPLFKTQRIFKIWQFLVIWIMKSYDSKSWWNLFVISTKLKLCIDSWWRETKTTVYNVSIIRIFVARSIICFFSSISKSMILKWWATMRDRFKRNSSSVILHDDRDQTVCIGLSLVRAMFWRRRFLNSPVRVVLNKLSFRSWLVDYSIRRICEFLQWSIIDRGRNDESFDKEASVFVSLIFKSSNFNDKLIIDALKILECADLERNPQIYPSRVLYPIEFRTRKRDTWGHRLSMSP